MRALNDTVATGIGVTIGVFGAQENGFMTLFSIAIAGVFIVARFLDEGL